MNIPTTATLPIVVCPSTDLVEGGLAHKLAVTHANEPATAFFVRYKGEVHGYLNRCPHMGSELDWNNRVFTRDGEFLMCARHGASFKPDTGECTGGPGRPSKLLALEVSEEQHGDHQVVLWWPKGKTAPLE
ncbi:Rieske (2Fe-2S) protein [Candidimonas sp. SYP-B2681]|uniref:Rieske (2Fe-2S) protein n=1 Tax=Candidimonas sp. SYP-B2681 TaxID=2497686 RepID=UPI000F873E6F|nr:Rieske 2Fe-2S domain-containing protein [Candidimonas sp. SYP-B2681]RTZ41624.1 Rieske (2Fe-2S) protein [Candidimonas sp. SYP-B2681]